MKVKTASLTGPALDWAAAVAAGRVTHVPPRATNGDLEGLETPFKLYGATARTVDAKTTWSVEEITVTRFGIDHSIRASAPSISFIDASGRQGWGTASLFYLTREAAQADADQENLGGLEGFEPSTDWTQAGPVIESDEINLTKVGHQWLASRQGGHGHSYGLTPLAAAVRCFVQGKLGDEVDVPADLVETEQGTAPHPRMRVSP